MTKHDDDDQTIPSLVDDVTLTSDNLYRTIRAAKELNALLLNTPENAIQKHDLKQLSRILNGILEQRELYIEQRRTTIEGQLHTVMLQEQLTKERKQ